MIRKQKAFTLIELMVVVAVIAILATLGITNFSSAIRKARDSKRLADIQAVAKALETCYEINTAVYNPNSVAGSAPLSNATNRAAWTDANVECLGSDIRPGMAGYEYSLQFKKIGATDNAAFCACAQLEDDGSANNVNNDCAGTSPPDGSNGPFFYCVESSQGEWN